jgi:hypothetical protein
MQRYPIVPERCLVAGAAVVALAALVALAMHALGRRGWLSDDSVYWTGMLAASVPAGVMPLLTPGGWLNNLIGPAMLLWIVVLHLACDGLRGLRSDPALSLRGTHWVVGVLAAFLLGALYDPRANVPDAERTNDVAALQAMPQLSLIADLDLMRWAHLSVDLPGALRGAHAKWVILFGHAQEQDLRAWLGPGYREHPIDLRVQALQEETRRGMTLLEREP